MLKLTNNKNSDEPRPEVLPNEVTQNSVAAVECPFEFHLWLE